MAINWKKRISEDDRYIDVTGLPYYTLKFDDNCEYETIYGINVKIPVAPNDKDCINYNLPVHDQIFRKNYRPPQVLSPDKEWGREAWTKAEIDAFVDQEWNIRKQGVWFWIKGKKTYIPGQLWFKLNAWTPETNQELEYRDHERELFTFALQVQRDVTDLGIADYKCRQLGDTENALVMMYERGSRIRGGLTTMQSFINQEHVERTYSRLIHAHKNMPYWFRPMNTGTEDPKKGLILDYPSRHITHAEVERKRSKGESVIKSSKENYQYPPIGSKFVYGPSKVKHFDGATGLLTCYGDEFGKSSDEDPNEWVQTMAEAAFDSNRGKKRAFMMMTSTVEDITPECLERAQRLYRESDPDKRISSGSTISRLIRIFRGVDCRGFENIVADRWGFIDKEAVINAVTEKYNAMMDAGNTRGAMSFIRKNPRRIEDVFMSAMHLSAFNVEGLQKREYYLSEIASPKPYVRGNLKWKDGVRDTTVIWEPNPRGRWVISKHPHDYGLESNAKVMGVIAPKPANTFFFGAGVDPIDQSDTLETNPSKGSICLGRRFDMTVDNAESLYYQHTDELQGIVKGKPVDMGSGFITNRPICTYLERPDNTSDFFEDVIMTMVYYGSDFLPEKNKFGGLHTYLKSRGYDLYLMDRPTNVKNVRGKTEKDGVTATVNSMNMCFDFITTYTFEMANAIDHPDLLSQLMTMNWKNRGDKDLGVAFGWMLYAFNQKKTKLRDVGDNPEQAETHWHYNEAV